MTGKTCTGKTTLAHRLCREFDYEIIELDQIVYDALITPFSLPSPGQVFIEVYRNRDASDWIEQVLTATQAQIAAAFERGKSVVVDGAVANVETLSELLQPYPESERLFAYLHPVDIEKYEKNLRHRFELTRADFDSGLPKRFWDFVDNKEFEKYCQTRAMSTSLIASITKYATSSQTESEIRLAAFERTFGDVVEVNV